MIQQLKTQVQSFIHTLLPLKVGAILVVFLALPAAASAAQIDFTTDYYGGTGASTVIGESDLSATACNNAGSNYNANTPICGDKSFWGTTSAYVSDVYDVNDLTAPVLNSYIGGDWSGVFNDGEYYGIVAFHGAGSINCGSSQDISSCISQMQGTGGGFYYTTVKFCVSGSGTVMAEGSCGSPPPPPSSGGSSPSGSSINLQQLDNSATLDSDPTFNNANHHPRVIQGLGTGIVGSVDQITLKSTATSDFSTAATLMILATTSSESVWVDYIEHLQSNHAQPYPITDEQCFISQSTDVDSQGNVVFATSTPCVLDGSKFYYLVLFPGYNNPGTAADDRYWLGSNASFNGQKVFRGYSVSNYDPAVVAFSQSLYFVFQGASIFGVGDTSRTRVVSVRPVSGSSVATGTNAFSATIYVASVDYSSSTVLKIYGKTSGCDYAGVSVYTVVENPCVDFYFTFPVTSSGQTTYTGTTSLSVLGRYNVSTTITKPSFSFLGFNVGNTAVAATSTFFFVSTSTTLDLLQAEAERVWADLASTTLAIGTVCNPVSISNFSLGLCLSYLFVPSASVMSSLAVGFVNNVLTIPPWGYISRITYDLFYAPIPDNYGSLPLLSVDLKDTHLPGTAGVSAVSLDLYGNLLGPGTILSEAESPKDGKSLKEIVEPGWTMFVYLLLAFALSREILGIGGKVVSTTMD